MSKIIVVGGGASGMMAAIIAARNGNDVTLLEKNEKLGKKLFITGKGRCNITNACDTEELFDNVVSNKKFLYSAFYGFDNKAVMDFFEELGLRLKVERGNRVFPESDHSSDVIKALEYEMRRLLITISLNTTVTSLIIEQDKICGVKLKGGKKLEADEVLVATGGISYPLTGSTGDGHKMAADSGHEITKMYPALVPLKTKERWCYALMGLSLKNVSVTIKNSKKEIFSDFGEMLFTHYGVSGPLIISASSFLCKLIEKEELKMTIDLKPALSEEQLDKRLLRDFEENNNKQFKNAIGGLFPSKLIPVMIEQSGINPEKKVNEITKEERKQFIDRIKNLPLTITGTSDYSEAIITQGGISVKEINPSTMESKKIKGLFFAGEIIDVDALTGGFNLQIAFSTAYLAGQAM